LDEAFEEQNSMGLSLTQSFSRRLILQSLFGVRRQSVAATALWAALLRESLTGLAVVVTTLES